MELEQGVLNHLLLSSTEVTISFSWLYIMGVLLVNGDFFRQQRGRRFVLGKGLVFLIMYLVMGSLTGTISHFTFLRNRI